MSARINVTEYLDIDLDTIMWVCNRCDFSIIPATENYKHGCAISVRSPDAVYPPVIEGDLTFSPDPEWIKIVEFYCPNCGTMFDNEFLPPGHPITHDIQFDITNLKLRLGKSAI